MPVFNNRLHYENGMSAAVGPANNGIDPGLELGPDGHALTYDGTTIGNVERWKKEIPHRTKERKDSFYSMMKVWANMQLRIHSTRREEQRLAALRVGVDAEKEKSESSLEVALRSYGVMVDAVMVDAH